MKENWYLHVRLTFEGRGDGGRGRGGRLPEAEVGGKTECRGDDEDGVGGEAKFFVTSHPQEPLPVAFSAAPQD